MAAACLSFFVMLSCWSVSYAEGIAAKYPGDQGIQNDPDVIYFGNFESDSWYLAWGTNTKPANADLVDIDPGRKFLPLQGKALRVKIAQDSNVGISLEFRFLSHLGTEPEEVYFRYYLRFGDDWNPLIDGGKLPGPAGTYGRAGWGGRRSDGTNGWSARGLFGIRTNGLSPIGSYVYHADQPSQYGDGWIWDRNKRGYLRNNRWYSLEHYIRLNNPTRRDGILRAWVDGQLAFEKTNLRFRTVDTLKIETIWMNVYHGGTEVAASDHHLYIDNVVIARSYIGPMNGGGVGAGRARPGSVRSGGTATVNWTR